MQTRISKTVFQSLLAVAWLAGAEFSQPVFADGPAPVPLPAPRGMALNPAKGTIGAGPLAWDAQMKENTPAQGASTAEFVFTGTNISTGPVVIQRVQTSCGCTVAKLPSEPYTVQPGTNVDIKVTVNLAGKSGTFFKTITVISTNTDAQKTLTIKVVLPENPNMMRARNQSVAMADHQAIFHGDCARCHVEPTRGKMGKELYTTACGICHDASPRATMVPNLHYLPHPTDYAYWHAIISDGKPNTLMAGFAQKNGGPLTEAQIDSLAKEMVAATSHDQPAAVKLPPPRPPMLTNSATKGI